MHVGFQNKTNAASLKCRKWGLGRPKHMRRQFIVMNTQVISINTDQGTLLVLNRAIILPLLLSLLGVAILYLQTPLCRYAVCMYVLGEQRIYVGRYNTRYAQSSYIDNGQTSFGHQSGLDESQGRNSTTFLHGIVFRVYFSSIGENQKCCQMLTNTCLFQKCCVSQKTCGKPEKP